ncbi:MAG TPA: hypothetical protein VHA10_07020 [Hypericibacter adhaerens]|uniref:hypothetical protein n=1 Tax=Hypericibacter adhaerens TaxID=2602016 RepID=UPI002C10EBCA|nr:hypothetical protein [Hypericibacter adhaerens]HWA42944.1 hypothetical protein [Hypericibacter adhaerens]
MPDILFADAPDGTRLPVIDLTLPAFSVPESPEAIAALEAQALAIERQRNPLMRQAMGLLLRLFGGRSRLVAALTSARRGFLGGIPTYVMKLGPDNLVPPYATEIDRRVVATPIVASMRLRLAQVAALLSEGLAPLLAGNQRPLVILEIAGGPSADALNALIRLEGLGLLAGRRTRVIVYDLDDAGPAFARAMLEALQTGPLAGRDILLEHVAGNWSDHQALGRLAAGAPAGAVLAATSEGGLFEYGSDADIAGVLEALAPHVPLVTGSVTRNDELGRLTRRNGVSGVVPRGLGRFAELIAKTGYRIADSRGAVLSDQVRLTRD